MPGMGAASEMAKFWLMTAVAIIVMITWGTVGYFAYEIVVAMQ